MEQLISVRSLFKETDAYAGKQIKVGGWVRNLRASKNFGFINLSDGTFFSQVQVVYGSELLRNLRSSRLRRDLQAEHRRGRHRHRHTGPDARGQAAV